MRILPFIAPLLLLPAACALKDEALYPSLKPRPIESSERALAVPPNETAAPSDFAIPAADLQRLAELEGQLTAAEKDFETAFAATKRSGTPPAPGSEAYAIRAQAVGRLMAAHAPTAAIASETADLASRLSQQAIASGATLPADNPAATLNSRASAAAARQQARIDALAAPLNQ